MHLFRVFLRLFVRFLESQQAAKAAPQAGVAERYTRLSQKQVPQGLRVRISPPAPQRL